MGVHSDQSQQYRVLNLKAVVICGVVIAAVSFGMRKLHSHQMVKTTAYLREAARDAVSKGEPYAAIQALERYLAFSHDPEARRTLSELLTENASDRETLRTAYAMNEGLLLNDTANSELRLRQAELAVRLQLFSDADTHLKTLRADQPDNAQVWYLSGVVAQHSEHNQKAVDCYLKAVDYNCAEASCYARLADLVDSSTAGRTESERRFDQLITSHPSPDAHRVKAAWLLDGGRTDEAIAECWNGLQLAPDDLRLNSLLLSAVHGQGIPLLQNQNADQTRLLRHLQEQVDDHPGRSGLRLLCVHAQWSTGQQQEAIETLKAGITRNPQAFNLQEVMIDLLVSRGDTEQARAAFLRLPRTALSHARWHFLEGRLLMGEQQWTKAAVSFEKAAGFSEADAGISHRSGMCLAVCRRELGERDVALETYRSMINDRPDSQDSRLAIAATWLEVDRADLAIAEYRQLQDVPGVPELLTSLLIRETLRQPATQRDWTEAETLISELGSSTEDASQQLLLRADLMFAKGHPAQALQLLDQAVRRYPHSAALEASRHRVLADRHGLLRQQMDTTLNRQPDSLEAHITLLRLLAHQQGQQSAVAAVGELIDGLRFQQLSPEVRLRTAAQAAELIAADLRKPGDKQTADAMLDQAENAWTRLAVIAPDAVPQRLAFISRYRRHDSVLEALNSLSTTMNPEIGARACLAALANSSEKTELREAVEQSLRQSIVNQPADLQLRQLYADYLLQFAEYEQALMIERQILQFQPRNVTALCRGAWILTMSDGDHAEALTLSESAARFAPENSEVRITRALVLAHSDTPADALPVLRSVPTEVRSPESFAYEAFVLLRTGSHDQAAQTAKRVQQLHAPECWRPADRQLLQEVLREVTVADVAGR